MNRSAAGRMNRSYLIRVRVRIRIRMRVRVRVRVRVRIRVRVRVDRSYLGGLRVNDSPTKVTLFTLLELGIGLGLRLGLGLGFCLLPSPNHCPNP